MVTAVQFSNGQEVLFIDYSGAKYACLALPVLRDVITSVFSKSGHKAPPKSLEHLRLREQRRQPLQKFSQKAPQSPALKPPSTARTAGRSDWAERRFRRQPFILLSFSSSEKPQKRRKRSHINVSNTLVARPSTPPAQTPQRSFQWAAAGTYATPAPNRAHSGSQGETGAFRVGALSLPSDRFARFGNPARPGIRTAHFAALGAWSGALPKNTESLRNSDALMRVAVPQASRPRWAAQPLLWSSWLSCFCLKPLLQTALRHGTMVSPNRNP